MELTLQIHYHQQLLEVEDLCDSAHPDERSVMTYIASYFHAFSTMGETIKYCAPQTTLTCLPIDQATTVSRRVDKFAELMQSVWLIKNDYERRVRLVTQLLSLTFFYHLNHIFSAVNRPLLHPIPMVSSSFHRYLHRRQRPISRIHHLQTNYETNLGCRKTRRSYPFRECSDETTDLRSARVFSTSRAGTVRSRCGMEDVVGKGGWTE